MLLNNEMINYGTVCASWGVPALDVSSDSGWHVLYVGGNWNNGSNAGLLQFNANYNSSNSNSNISARLLFSNTHNNYCIA